MWRLLVLRSGFARGYSFVVGAVASRQGAVASFDVCIVGAQS
jgi:hypothetical protein